MARIALACNSILLKTAIERFLGGKLAPLSLCDFVLCDERKAIQKPQLIIGEHISKPFSKESLIAAIARFEKLDEIRSSASELFGGGGGGGNEREIADLYDRFARELLEILRRK